ncbi:MAG TPA: 4-alpha-glucanotransferase [Acidobacteriaceae bacterium]
MPFERSSGLLLHVTSLPSVGGIGDLGPAAYAFANFLASAGQRIWQVLPLNPVGYGNSPYGALSAFAGNPLLVSLEVLADWGWLSHDRLHESLRELPGASGPVDYEAVTRIKQPLLEEAALSFLQHRTEPRHAQQAARFEAYCARQQAWLDDYAAYTVLRRSHDYSVWTDWPAEYARRQPEAMRRLRAERADELDVVKAIQFAFDEQWTHLRTYCEARKIKLMGDIAIFVSYDSADVWTHPDIFELREDLTPIHVSGVPPDYFSATGQRWGNPLYRWDKLAASGFDWWVARVRRATEIYDMVRLDHFRGFEAFWSIPGEDETAQHGHWVKAPGHELFRQMEKELGTLPFVAEDLGVITQEVDALRRAFGLPGMRILQFGFGDRGAHTYLPHRYEANTVAYTGTHDNDTTLGWWHNGASEAEKEAVETYLKPGADGVVWAMIRAAATSVADICLFPVQDVLELGSEARMNVPSAAQGNWSWRCPSELLTLDVAEKLSALVTVTDRDGVPVDPMPTDAESEAELTAQSATTK